MTGSENIAKDTSTRFHPELDLSRLRAFHESLRDSSPEYRATLSEEVRAEMDTSVDDNLATINHLIARDQAVPPNGVPCDTFNFMHGTAPDPTMTKFGGAPYWPANRPWPKDWRGRPLSYLGQVNFCDSLDIVGDLPGEILLLFVNEHDRVSSHWLDLTDEPLIEQNDLPTDLRHFGSRYGVIHRTYNLPDKTLAEETAARSDVESSIFQLKIGGQPWGHTRFKSGHDPFLFQMELPCQQEEYDDGSISLSTMFIICKKWYWPFSKRQGKGANTFQIHWTAAYLKANGKLRWSWA